MKNAATLNVILYCYYFMYDFNYMAENVYLRIGSFLKNHIQFEIIDSQAIKTTQKRFQK